MSSNALQRSDSHTSNIPSILTGPQSLARTLPVQISKDSPTGKCQPRPPCVPPFGPNSSVPANALSAVMSKGEVNQPLPWQAQRASQVV